MLCCRENSIETYIHTYICQMCTSLRVYRGMQACICVGERWQKQTKRPACGSWSKNTMVREEWPNDIIPSIVIHIAVVCIMYEIRITHIYNCIYCIVYSHTQQYVYLFYCNNYLQSVFPLSLHTFLS